MSNDQKFNQVFFTKRSPTPTESQLPVDTENDGVYTNHKYKFRFIYPADIFDEQAKSDPNLKDNDPWDYAAWSRSMDGTLVGKKFVHLDVRVETADGDVAWPALHDFEESTRLRPGQSLSNGKGTKLDNYERGNVRGAIFYFKVPAGVEYDFPGYLYSAEFLKDERLIVIQLMSNDYQTLRNNKKIFDSIVDSFEYVD